MFNMPASTLPLASSSSFWHCAHHMLVVLPFLSMLHWVVPSTHCGSSTAMRTAQLLVAFLRIQFDIQWAPCPSSAFVGVYGFSTRSLRVFSVLCSAWILHGQLPSSSLDVHLALRLDVLGTSTTLRLPLDVFLVFSVLPSSTASRIASTRSSCRFIYGFSTYASLSSSFANSRFSSWV